MSILRQFLQPSLGHASYLVGDADSRRAIVVDPMRDPTPYLDAAHEDGLEIVWVMDTHGHNDYLSGRAELIEATGARALAPIGSTVGYEATLTRHGMQLELGPNVRIELLHTPGHTPEHTAALVTGLGERDVLLSGGSLLIGDVGRPDLLGTMRQRSRAAEALATTVLDLLESLEDDVLVLPTHVGGSLCAGAIADGTETTIATERAQSQTIRAIIAAGRENGVWLDADLLPPVPSYWPTSRRLNLQGVPVRPLDPYGVDPTSVDDEWLVLDVRDPYVHAERERAGSINVPLGGSFPVWAGILAHGATDIAIIADDEQQALRAHVELLRVHPLGARAWVDGATIERTPGASRRDANDLLAEVGDGSRVLVDVRNPAEFAERPLPGATQVSAIGLLTDAAGAPDAPLAVACASGYRAIVVASALRRVGRDAIAIDGSPFEALPATTALATH